MGSEGKKETRGLLGIMGRSEREKEHHEVDDEPGEK